jgi:hypothetical protein
VGADDARLPSLHEIASRPHPANHAQRAGHQQPNPTNLAAGAAPLPARCAAAACSLSVQPVHCPSSQSVCAPRSSIIAPRSSLLAPPGVARQFRTSQAGQAKRRNSPVPSHPRTTPPLPPSQQAIPLPANAKKSPLLDTAPKSDKAVGPPH